MSVDVNTVTGILDEVSKRLSEPAKHTYSVLVKQAVADGAGDLVLCSLCVAGIGFALYFIPKLMKVCADNDSKGNEGIAASSAFVILMLGIWAVYSVLFLPFDLIDGIKHIINPEYYAIMDIMSKIK